MSPVTPLVKKDNAYFLPGDVPEGENPKEVPVDANIEKPVLTSCCNTVFAKEALLKELIEKNEPSFSCPKDGCKKPISVENLGLFARKSSNFKNEYKVVYKEQEALHPFTGKQALFEGYVASCCDKEFSKGVFGYHLSNRSISNLGSCPHCKTAVDLSDAVPDYKLKRTLLRAFEYTAKIATLVAIGALCLSNSTFLYLASGIAITAIGLGIITASCLTKSRLTWNNLHVAFSAALLCSGSYLAFTPFLPTYAAIAGVALGLFLTLSMELIFSPNEPEETATN